MYIIFFNRTTAAVLVRRAQEVTFADSLLPLEEASMYLNSVLPYYPTTLYFDIYKYSNIQKYIYTFMFISTTFMSAKPGNLASSFISFLVLESYLVVIRA